MFNRFKYKTVNFQMMSLVVEWAQTEGREFDISNADKILTKTTDAAEVGLKDWNEFERWRIANNK